MWAKEAVFLLLVSCLGMSATFAHAAEWSGFVAGDLRFFPQSPALPLQNDGVLNPSILLQPEWRHEWNSGNDRLTVVPFARIDSHDPNRTHWDIREFNWLHVAPNWDARVGIGKVFWGTTESRHLVDIINQTDLIEKFSGEEKLGQPMLNLNVPSRYGHFSLFYLPYFRERTFPAAKGRFLYEPRVRTSEGERDGFGRWQPSLAARWSQTFGDWDLGLAHFWGTGREPRLRPDFADGFGQPPTALIPVYDLIHQSSVDIQGAKGNWLWKLEAMTRSGQGKRFAALVAGLEYTHYGVFGGSKDIGLLFEYLYDGRSAAAPPTPFNNDIFVGLRVAFNNAPNTELLVSATIDLDTQATILGLNASRRLHDKWKIEVESRFFAHIPATRDFFQPPSEILTGMRRDGYFQLRLIRYF